MTETWFRINPDLSISAVEVTTWTRHTVILATGRRVKRKNYRITWKEARSIAIARATRAVGDAALMLKMAQGRLAEVKRLPK